MQRAPRNVLPALTRGLSRSMGDNGEALSSIPLQIKPQSLQSGHQAGPSCS